MTGTKYGELDAIEANKRGFLPATVLVDGQPVQDCVVFNDIEGWADVYVRDEEGNYKINYSADGLEVRRLHGSIEYIPYSKS